MAQYYLKSHPSMNLKQRQRKFLQEPPKLAINILTPNNENKIPENLLFSQALHKEYDAASSCSNTKRSSKVESSAGEGRMKLRDYLFLAKTSALKNADQKKKAIMTVHENNQSYKSQQVQAKKRKQELRKDKYNIKNSEMFKILKEEMDKEIHQSLQEISTIKSNLDKQLMQHTIPSNGEMVMMYNLRSLIKEKLKKSIEQMKELVSIQGSSGHEERVEMEIDIENDFKGDFKLAAIAYSRKFLEMTQANNNI